MGVAVGSGSGVGDGVGARDGEGDGEAAIFDEVDGSGEVAPASGDSLVSALEATWAPVADGAVAVGASDSVITAIAVASGCAPVGSGDCPTPSTQASQGISPSSSASARVISSAPIVPPQVGSLW